MLPPASHGFARTATDGPGLQLGFKPGKPNKKGPLGAFLDFDLERVRGIEPLYEAWEAAVLPLNYTRRASAF